MEEQDFLGVIGQRQRFLQRRVAAADDADGLAVVQRAVAAGAMADAAAHEFFFSRDTEMLERRAGGDDHCFGLIAFFLRDHRPEYFLAASSRKTSAR